MSARLGVSGFLCVPCKFTMSNWHNLKEMAGIIPGKKKKKKKQPISNLHMHIYLSDIAANSAVLWAAPLHLTNFSPFAQLVLADKCAGWWSIPFYTFPCQQQGPQIFCWNAKQEHIPDRLICKFGVKLFCGWCRMRGPLMCTHQEGVHIG